MSQLERFEIELEHDIDEQYQYEPGELLRGTVIVKARDSIRVRSILLQIKGEASVSWEEPKGSVKADEVYVEEVITLLQSPTVESVTLNKGTYKYPFQFPLPQNLPSSFIGKFGSVTYVLKATLREDSKFGLNPTITSEPFLVLRKLDIANDAALLQPSEKQAARRIWGTFAFCMSGRVSVTLKVNRRAFLPGEDIVLDAIIDNSSPRHVIGVQASLVMHSRFHAHHKSSSNTQTVNKRYEAWDMGNGEERAWKNVRLTVPPYIPESRLDGCDVIDIDYELQLRVDVDGDTNVIASVPVVIGTTKGGGSGANGSGAAVGVEGSSARPRLYQTKDQRRDNVSTDGNDNEKQSRDGDSRDGGNGHMYNNEDDDDEENGGLDGIDFAMNEEESEQFRRPMEPGTTRKNPIFVRD